MDPSYTTWDLCKKWPVRRNCWVTISCAHAAELLNLQQMQSSFRASYGPEVLGDKKQQATVLIRVGRGAKVKTFVRRSIFENIQVMTLQSKFCIVRNTDCAT